MTGGMPPVDGWEAKIMHGSITVGGITVSGADLPAGQYEQPRGFRIFLEADDPADTERLFNALAENATIEMPLQQTFWSLSFGVLTDQFGIPWTLSCSQGPDPTPEAAIRPRRSPHQRSSCTNLVTPTHVT